ncbi:2-keto-4-pentenoate hydratase [bacterium]|nr:MAG: 2-keto-4-pentenoate hydratase [bacterium]
MNAKQDRIQAIADMLDRALHERHYIDPVIMLEPGLNIEDAYAIQMKNVAREVERGAVISGKKIGLTSLAMQTVLGVGEPDYGHLLNTMDVSHGKAPIDRLLQPKAEGEIAFVLKEDIAGPNATLEDVLAATDYVVAAIEIVDCRIRDWRIKLIDTVADNASSGLYVLGPNRVRPDKIMLVNECMQLYKNGEWVNAGCGADVMGHPALCVAWLTNMLHRYGVTLKRGEVVLSGALSAAVVAQRGDRFEAVFNQLGTVKVEFV